MSVERWQLGQQARRQAPMPGGPAIEIVVGADRGLPVGVLSVALPPGGAMPEHDHGDSTVVLVPLAGRLRLVEAGDGGSVTELEPGALATIPVGQRVRLENAGDGRAQTLAILTPADFVRRLESWPAEAPELVEALAHPAPSVRT